MEIKSPFVEVRSTPKARSSYALGYSAGYKAGFMNNPAKVVPGVVVSHAEVVGFRDGWTAGWHSRKR
jgi:hypothetical protein